METPLKAIISRVDELYNLKWPSTNNTFLNSIYKWRVTLIRSIFREKAVLPARRLLHLTKRCFVFLLCAVLFIALCMAPLKCLTDNECYAKFYFTPTREEMKRNVVVVLLFRKKAAKAFLFLMAHVKVIYKYYEEEAKSNQGTLRNIETSLVVKNIYGWIDLICWGIKPFYTVEKDLDCWYSKLNPIFYKTFMKPLQLGTPGSRGKRKLWDKQKCIGIKRMGEMQIFLKLMLKENMKKEFWHKSRTKKNLDIWTANSLYQPQSLLSVSSICWELR